MTGVDEILNYQRNPDDDYYALLGCDENSTVSTYIDFIKKYFIERNVTKLLERLVSIISDLLNDLISPASRR